nr:MAG TPA: hypothetical protein [Caudoviricetes sp.]
MGATKTIKRSTLRELTRLVRERKQEGNTKMDEIIAVCHALAMQAYGRDSAWLSFCDIAFAVMGWYPLKPDCTVEEFEELFKWLGFEIEDEGLTPADVKSMYAEWKTMMSALNGIGGGYARLRELAEADRDGRVVALPCKVGQRVFALMDTDKRISECEVKQIGMGNEIVFIGLEPIGARGREYGVALNGFGKTVFLTREEAEKALEAMKDG